jgi:3D (Asp-Asp-Asp) domain-containing protein
MGYHPSVGRFAQRDPKEEGQNLYEYAAGQPGSKTDPLGTSAYPPGMSPYGPGATDQPDLFFDGRGNIVVPGVGLNNAPISVPANTPPGPWLPPIPATPPQLQKRNLRGDVGTRGESLGEFDVTAYNKAHEDDHPASPKIAAKGLGTAYNPGFLRDITMQGSGIDRQGRKIQLDWNAPRAKGARFPTSYRYVQEIMTAAGYPLEDGVSIATDPSVIPMGTWVYIDTVGWRQAVDTGGDISGKHIDLFMAVSRAKATAWGHKNLCVWKEKT